VVTGFAASPTAQDGRRITESCERPPEIAISALQLWFLAACVANSACTGFSDYFGTGPRISWPRTQSVICHDYRYVIGTPGGQGQVDQFLALLSWVATRSQRLYDLTFPDEVSEPICTQKHAVARHQLNLFNADRTVGRSACGLPTIVSEIWRRLFRLTRVTRSEPSVQRTIGRQSNHMVVAKEKNSRGSDAHREEIGSGDVDRRQTSP